MGKISQGILGGLSGKVGNVVGGNWKGIDYLRIKPSKVANPRTKGQVNQRNKFTASLEFLQPNIDFVKIGYKGFAVKKSEFNAAMSYVLNNAITGAAPDFEVDYQDALLSRGTLAGAVGGSTDLGVAGEVSFSWTDNSAGANANPDDKAMLLAYNPVKRESAYILDGADRSTEQQTLSIPSSYAGDEIHLFMAFKTADGERVSNSVYLGSGMAN